MSSLLGASIQSNRAMHGESLQQSSVGEADKFERIREACASKPHGVRARYIAGCRCMLCRAANSRYSVARDKAQKNGDWNGIVPADTARAHLLHLSSLGIGRHSVQAASDIPNEIIYAIITGKRKRIRARTERRILAVDEGARGGRSLVDAGPTWRLIDELVRRGYTKCFLARQLGHTSIQLRRDRITWRNAVAVRKLYTMIEDGRIQR